MATNRTVTMYREALPEALQNAVALWADATTDAASLRRADLLRDKGNAVSNFFSYTGKTVKEATPLDLKAWQAALEARQLAPATIYAKVSRVSSFYEWLLEDAGQADALGVHYNPVKLARPKAPKAYQSKSVKSLDDAEIDALVALVQARAASGDAVGLRDYALLVFYVTTGWRRAEIINLRWGDIKVNGGLLATVKVKGGDIEQRLVDSPAVRDALMAYLAASGRMTAMQPDAPLWTRHDRAGEPGEALTSHAFAKNMKRYAEQAGVGDFHLHQLRHTVARIMGEETGSIKAVQEILGHKSEAVTRVYLQRVGIHRDLSSARMAERLGL